MRYKDGFAIGIATALTGALLAPPARAEAPVSYALEYSAGENCPDEQAFVQAIQARAPLSTRTERSSANVVFEAHVDTERGVSRGFLLVRPAGGAVTRREVPDASCSEIVASMAVIAALVIEGLSEASAASPAAEVPAKEKPTAPAATPTPKPPAQKRAPAATPAPPPQQPEADVAAERPRQDPRAEAGGPRVGLAAAVGSESATAPELVPAFAVGFDVASRSRALLSPSARISGLYAFSGWQSVDGGIARFRWLAARLALCPALFSQDSVALRPCFELDAGDLEGQGYRTTTINPQTSSLLWLGAGAALHGEIALGRILALDGQFGGRVLVKPGRYVFRPDDTVAHETGSFSFGALIGLAARLP